VSKGGIIGGLRQVWLSMLRTRVVGDEVEVLACRCGDAERVLHQAIGLISGTFRFVVVMVLVATTARLRGLV
jgi:hypothetical protein